MAGGGVVSELKWRSGRGHTIAASFKLEIKTKLLKPSSNHSGVKLSYLLIDNHDVGNPVGLPQSLEGAGRHHLVLRHPWGVPNSSGSVTFHL